MRGVCAEGEVSRGPFIGLAFDPYLPAVSADDPLDAGQSNSGAWKIPLTVESLEGAKEL